DASDDQRRLVGALVSAVEEHTDVCPDRNGDVGELVPTIEAEAKPPTGVDAIEEAFEVSARLGIGKGETPKPVERFLAQAFDLLLFVERISPGASNCGLGLLSIRCAEREHRCKGDCDAVSHGAGCSVSERIPKFACDDCQTIPAMNAFFHLM